jgi:hypothetical protein
MYQANTAPRRSIYDKHGDFPPRLFAGNEGGKRAVNACGGQVKLIAALTLSCDGVPCVPLASAQQASQRCRPVKFARRSMKTLQLAGISKRSTACFSIV